MAKKIKVKLILELRAGNMSINQIVLSRHMSKSSVSDVFRIADELSITFNDIKEKEESEVYRMFYPDKYTIEDMYKQPDYEYIHKELKHIGVTLKLLHEEYVEKCKSENLIPVGYVTFCNGYKDYIIGYKLTNHIIHKPGIITEVDWSGPTMSYVDITTGEIIKVYLFVATLPYSQYSYVEPCLDMKQDTWLRCHVHMYEFFGGVTIKTVCDNLKTGVISHPKHGDIILNANYEALGLHYMTAIMPTGVRKPKQKASVEGTVGKVATAIIAKLRNKTFHSLQELKKEVSLKLNEFNKAPFQKREGSRKEVYEEEKRYLQPLPTIPYEIAEWIYGRKVNLDFHVVYDKNRYSCPYQYVGKTVDLKITDTLVEVYIKNERISTHNRFPEYVNNNYSTHKEDMPEQFKKQEWDDVRLKKWARSIGENTSKVIEKIINSVRIKEQGYNPALSVLNLGKTYSNERLELACGMALVKVSVPRYNHIKAILSTGQDKTYSEQLNAQKKPTQDSRGYIRGAEYYGGNTNG